jgi:hypothetical protein
MTAPNWSDGFENRILPDDSTQSFTESIDSAPESLIAELLQEHGQKILTSMFLIFAKNLQTVKSLIYLGTKGLKKKLLSSSARFVLCSQVWLHALPTRNCDVLIFLPPISDDEKLQAEQRQVTEAVLVWFLREIRRKEPRLRCEVRFHAQTKNYGIYLTARYDALLQVIRSSKLSENHFTVEGF